MVSRIKKIKVNFPLIDGQHLDLNIGAITIDEHVIVEILTYIKNKKLYKEMICFLKRGYNFVGYDLSYTRENGLRISKSRPNNILLSDCYLRKLEKQIKSLSKKKQYYQRKRTTWDLIKRKVLEV